MSRGLIIDEESRIRARRTAIGLCTASVQGSGPVIAQRAACNIIRKFLCLLDARTAPNRLQLY